MAAQLLIYTKEDDDSLFVCRRCETCGNYLQHANTVWVTSVYREARPELQIDNNLCIQRQKIGQSIDGNHRGHCASR
ncbi:hypothetical protein TNCV_3152141 [Trichonephila clavipes]|nr:hypothetical protein TNCV_3152141 [Trichonephila clavipes]